MILYANGCSHTAAAEAVVADCFAQDDGGHGIDRRPHPINLAASWCSHVAKSLDYKLICEAESGGSNARILRTTRQWIQNSAAKDALLIIQWTTWEREEWLHRGVWYQVNASGWDWVPTELRARYQEFVVNVDWHEKTLQAHHDIWQFHLELEQQNIAHVFFSGHSTFSDIAPDRQHNWGRCYVDPYLRAGSYHNWLMANGGKYANPKSYHFDAQSHRLWAKHVLQYLYHNNFTDCLHEIPLD